MVTDFAPNIDIHWPIAIWELSHPRLSQQKSSVKIGELTHQLGLSENIWKSGIHKSQQFMTP